MTLDGWSVEEIVEQELGYFRNLYEKGLLTFEEYQQHIYQTYDWAEEEYIEMNEDEYFGG